MDQEGLSLENRRVDSVWQSEDGPRVRNEG